MDAVNAVGLTLFADTFCARTDAYVYDSSRHVSEPITPELLEQVILTKHAVSGYTARLTEDGRYLTHVGAIDFDKTPESAPAAVQRTLTKLDVPSLISMSRRGAHLWVLMAPGDGTHGSDLHGDVPSASVRRMLEHAIRLTSKEYLAGVEIFPKPSASPFGCGALRLPLMSHPKTHTRYPVYDRHGNQVRKLIDLMEVIEYVPWAKVQELSREIRPEYPRSLGVYRKQTFITGPGAVGLLAQMGIEATVGHGSKCPFHDDAHSSLSVAADDQRVWCKNPECEAHNGGRGLGTLAMAKLIGSRKQ